MKHLLFLSIVQAIGAGSALSQVPERAQSSDAGAHQFATFSWGDFDADGQRDAFVLAADGTGRLLRGTTTGSFEDATTSAGLDGISNPSGAAWSDYDGDGDLDLFVGSKNGASHLFENAGNGSFADVTAAVGMRLSVGVEGAHWIDFDADGDLDLHVHAASGDVLLRNDAGLFEEVSLPMTPATRGAGVPTAPDAQVPDASAPTAGKGAIGSATRAAGSVAGGTRTAVEVPDDMRGGAGRVEGTAAGNGTRFGGITVNGTSTGYCADSVTDTGNLGNCVQASSVPELGKLYPLGSELFIDPIGNVGVGSLFPLSKLFVEALGGVDMFRARQDGVTKFILDSAGNVGIGVLTPAGKLHVNTGAGHFFVGDTGVGVGTLSPQGAFQVGSSDFVVGANGVGVGTTDPNSPLEIRGGVDASPTSEGYVRIGSPTSANILFDTNEVMALNNSSTADLYLNNDGGDVLISTATGAVGNLGIGTASPSERLHIAGNGSVVMLLEADANNVTETDHARIELSQDGGLISGSIGFANGLNDFRIMADDEGLVLGGYGQEALRVDSAADVIIKNAIEIRGGADIVERFDVDGDAVEPGMVLVIDPSNPGALTLATAAYDAKVAGIVSGAGGVNPGMCLSQEGVLDGSTPVAMTGRVYVRASTENGAIVPGDRLTTASLAGHAMKATDAARCDGAVIGKAMSSLDSETGLVLVLVNLQ